MAESVTFKVLEDRGAGKHAKELIVRQGSELFGEPPPAVRETLDRISVYDLVRLDGLLLRLLKVNSWEELMAEPAPKKKAAKRKKPKA
jgi:hypothetical protein